MYSSGKLTVVNSTIADNYNTTSAPEGATGLSCEGDCELVMQNSIVWGNTGGSLWVPDGSMQEVIYNCIESPEPWLGEGNLDEDPRFIASGTFDFGRVIRVDLGPRRFDAPDYVIRSPNYYPSLSSAVIDSGSPGSAPPMDLAGAKRPCGSEVDMGAFERCGLFFRRGDSNTDSDVNVSDAITILNHLFLGRDTPGCLKTADSNDTGDLDLTDGVYLLNALFVGGPQLPNPGASCGVDESEDIISCDSYDACPQ
jgi:hypothetical protein